MCSGPQGAQQVLGCTFNLARRGDVKGRGRKKRFEALGFVGSIGGGESRPRIFADMHRPIIALGGHKCLFNNLDFCTFIFTIIPYIIIISRIFRILVKDY
jgi:hypothetical protein